MKRAQQWTKPSSIYCRYLGRSIRLQADLHFNNLRPIESVVLIMEGVTELVTDAMCLTNYLVNVAV